MLALLLGAALAATPPTVLVTEVQVGASQSSVVATLEKLGATEVRVEAFDAPGAFARGTLERPSLLALLQRAGVQHPFFDALPKSGPTFVTARIDEARAAYAFVAGKLWSMALTLPYEVVRPSQDPFDPQRLEPLRQALDDLCADRRPVATDDYRNPIAWKSASCRGGRASLWYEPDDPEATLKVVVHR